MIQSMYNAVSGLRGTKISLDVISNNVANIGTTGFKSSSVSFSEMFNQTIQGATAPSSVVGGRNPAQIGLGVSVSSITTSNTQGSLQATGKATDVAIEGDGYLITSNGTAHSYTRDGSLLLDGEGTLVSSASSYAIQGWSADPGTGVIDTTQQISNMSLPVGSLSVARATTQAAIGGNLDASTENGLACNAVIQAYDSLGTAHAMNIAFTKISGDTSQGYADTDTTTLGTGTVSIAVGSETPVNITLDASNNTLQGLRDAINASSVNATATIVDEGSGTTPYQLEIVSEEGAVVVDTSGLTAGSGTVPVFSDLLNSRWNWNVSSDDVDPSAGVLGGVLTFDTSGKPVETYGDVELHLLSPNGAQNPMDIRLSFDEMTQLSGENTVSPVSQNGLPLGVLESFTIGSNGIVTGAFTNGMSQALGQIAMAKFSNPAGLCKIGGNSLIETPNSGLPQVGVPSVGNMGSLAAGFLESSNVDLSSEFANMIVAQRAFQANSRIITTSDEVLQELVQLKR